ncbi:GNAT family N-acetyltransferase [Tardisphaera saccharovorans]
MGVEFRELNGRDEDLDEALRIYEESFGNSPTSIPVEFLRGIIGRRAGPRLAVLRDGVVVAMAIFARLDRGSIIWYLAVDYRYRRRGLGSQLVKSVSNVLSGEVKAGPEAFLYAEFEDKIVPFWKANGFYVLPIRYYQPPMRGAWVRLNLGVLPLLPRSSLTSSTVRDFIYEIYTTVYKVKDQNDEHVRHVLEDCSRLGKLTFNLTRRGEYAYRPRRALMHEDIGGFMGLWEHGRQVHVRRL